MLMSALYKTTFVVEVLSDFKPEDYELSYLLDADTCDHHVSVNIKRIEQKVVSPELNFFGGEE
jgi:hypothetical protein